MLRQFRVAEPIGVHRHDRSRLIGWQTRQARAETRVWRLHGGSGRIDRVGDIQLFDRTAQLSHIERSVAGDHPHPGERSSSIGIITPGVPPDAQERLLDGVLRHLVIAEDFEGDGKKFAGRRIMEFSERRRVADGDTLQQRLRDVPCRTT